MSTPEPLVRTPRAAVSTPLRRITSFAERVTRAPDVAARAVLPVLMALAAAFFAYQGRGFVFHFDEWNWIMNRRAWNAAVFLEPHNEHAVAVPMLIFKLLFVTVGLDDYWPYRLVVLAFHLTIVALVFALARRRVLDALALVAAIPILFLGAGWENIVWPFQITFLGSVAAGLGMLLALDRRDARGDGAASLLLALSLASSSLGLPVAVAALVEVLARPRRSQRLWLVALPVAAYGLWQLAYGSRTLRLSNVATIPTYAADSAAAVFGALAGLNVTWGRPIALIVLILLARHLVLGNRVTVRFAAVTAALASFWILAGLSRGIGGAGSSRYVYVGAVFIVLAAVELAPPVRWSRPASAVLLAVLATFLVGNWAAMRGGVDHLRSVSGFIRAELAALELAGPSTNPEYRVDMARAPDITAGAYFEAVNELGSPADSLDELRRRRERERQAADVVLTLALGVAVEPPDPERVTGAPPAVDDVFVGDVAMRDSCVEYRPVPPGGHVDVTLPRGGIAIDAAEGATVVVRLRRFGNDYPEVPTATVAAGARVTLSPRPDRAPDAWHARLSSEAPVMACSLRETQP